jgi:hypothetical protein
MSPMSTQGRNRRLWIQCLLQQRLRKGAIPEHTRQFRASLRRHHCRYPAAELWRGPGGDSRGTVLQEKGCSKFAEPLCTWCALGPHNYIERNAPCVRQMPAALIFEEEHSPDKNKIYNEHNAHN